MDTARKTISFVIQAKHLTSEIVKSVLNDFLNNKTVKTGKIKYSKIAKNGKLDSIEVTENNIKDFMSTAKKYDIDYALKRDSSTQPPTYHIFFTANSSETFKKAFQEYATGISKKLQTKSVSQVVNREQIKANAKIISQKQSIIDREKHKAKTDIAGR